jgi:hypothetical protein
MKRSVGARVRGCQHITEQESQDASTVLKSGASGFQKGHPGRNRQRRWATGLGLGLVGWIELGCF